MFGCVAMNHVYEDSGVFCIMSSAHPSQVHVKIQNTTYACACRSILFVLNVITIDIHELVH